ncbi:sulfatase-like hydrolase/transferase [Ornithinimicrobium cavernae]|uniref:sulfatase-like hydrolase/transferase n=1 Tax=Ornithinimicrobium cavernae TaxID=2666047 RepID=UPI000D69A27D|nr:sulfatase-like hydrolase/transferase [Ornithinimicrobium cavernae]
MTSRLSDRQCAAGAAEVPFEAMGVAPPARPNILFVLADDLGWGDLGCYGSLQNDTPHLDQLAADGLRLTDAYAASPTCSPTRVALYTGRYPGRLAVGLEEPLLTRDEHHGIPPGHPTLPSLLRDSGYRTAMVGKWHCGWLPWFSPLRIGFDEFFGNIDGVADYYSHIDSTGTPDLYEGEEPVVRDGYYTELLTERAVRFIEDRAGEDPFYLQLNYTAPHFPWEAPGDRELSDQVTQAVQEKGPRGMFHFDGGSLDTYRRMIASLDDGVGQVLEALERTGARDNTIVIFASDNGGERWAFLWPFVGSKGHLEEGGIRVPFIVRWPSVLRAGTVTNEPVITMDWTATLLDAAGCTPDPDYPLDGQSLLPWLVGGVPLGERSLRWRTRSQGAVRRGRFKMVHDRRAKPLWHMDDDVPASRTKLYDLGVDGREMADVSAHHPQVCADLLREFTAMDEELLPYEQSEPLEGVAGIGLRD